MTCFENIHDAFYSYFDLFYDALKMNSTLTTLILRFDYNHDKTVMMRQLVNLRENLQIKFKDMKRKD